MRVFDPQWLYDRFAFWYAVVDAVNAALPSMLSLTRFGSDNQQTTTFIEADADSSFNMLNWVIGGSRTSCRIPAEGADSPAKNSMTITKNEHPVKSIVSVAAQSVVRNGPPWPHVSGVHSPGPR